MPDDRDLLDLVDTPTESLTIEIKSNFDIANDRAHRAHSARHICALANFGGGFIVFGFDNDLRPIVLPADIDQTFHRDRVSSIVATYLDPALLCDSVIITSSAGNRHPVIRVPSHGAAPVCAKANGPLVNGGNVGIVAGRHYIRQVGPTGPESVAISSSSQWTPIIRRCVAVERATLVGIIERFLDPNRVGATPLSTIDTLEQWHDAAALKFRELVRSEKLQWSVPLESNFYQFSYEFTGVEGSELPAPHLLDILARANSEMRDLVWTGWSMLYPFRRPEIAPYFVTDAYPGQGSSEVLEANLLGERMLTSTLPDFWRVSANGKATIVRAYREDRSGYPHPAGTTLSPFMTARDVAEFVRHARAMATHFGNAQTVRFRCEWHGLRDRQLRDGESDPSVMRVSRSNHILSTFERPIADLTASWPAIVSTLIGRVARSFDADLDLSPEWVARIAPRFRAL